MMELKKRTEVCDEIIALARDTKSIPQAEWKSYEEADREHAEWALVAARNILKGVFTDET